MAVRLLVLAHAPTERTRDAVFGAGDGLLPLSAAPDLGRVGRCRCGPERAPRETAAWVGQPADPLPGLAGCDFGTWSGLALADVVGADPAGLDSWLTDPYAAPHGGESLAGLVARVGDAVDSDPWVEGRNLAVVTPLVARALAVHALAAPAEVIFRVDVGPLGLVTLSRSGSAWRLQGLRSLAREETAD